MEHCFASVHPLAESEMGPWSLPLLVLQLPLYRRFPEGELNALCRSLPLSSVGVM